MNRKVKFLTGLAAATLTFGSLMATLGPRHFAHHRGHCHHLNHCRYYDQNQKQCIQSSETPSVSTPLEKQYQERKF